MASTHGLAADRRRWTLAERGIMLGHPFMDPRILSLALGVRLRRAPRADEHKALLCHAMRDVLPERIRKRRGKVNFNEIYYRGLARNLPYLEDLIRTSHIAEFEVIDKDILIRCLQQTALGCETGSAGGDQLNLMLSLLTWLSIRDRTPPYRELSADITRIPISADVRAEAQLC